MNEYYQIARKLGSLDRASLARELRAFHQGAVAAAIERAADAIREGREAGASLEQIEADVRSIELDGRQVADANIQLRQAEAVLLVLLQGEGAVSLSRATVAATFDRGDGVDLIRGGATVEIVPQRRKFAGQ